MATRVQALIETLEVHLARTQRELNQLRQENARLKSELAGASSESAHDGESGPVLQQGPTEAPTPPRGEDAKAQPPFASTADAFAPPSPHALLKQWYERYPNAFFTGHTKPLKVGIHHDLMKREPWSGKLIRRALANYVNLPRYAKSMREGAERVDLDGLPAGKVDKEASRHANERRKDQAGEKTTGNAPTPAAGKAKSAAGKSASTRAGEARNPAKAAKAREQAPEKNDERKPLSMEEKIKGLMQKFEGR